MKNIALIALLTLLAGCGSGGSDNDSLQSSQDRFLSTGMYQATDGSGYSDFHDLKFEEGGYLDITNYKSTVGLYDQSLAVINSDLASDDYIAAGEYKLKFTYQPTSLIPGNVTIFSLELIEYSDLPSIESKTYNAVGSYGSYSEYYKLDMGVGGYVDVTTTKATVYVYNKTLYQGDAMPLTSHYENITGNTYLNGGEYIVKFTYSATSLTPGTVSFQK